MKFNPCNTCCTPPPSATCSPKACFKFKHHTRGHEISVKARSLTPHWYVVDKCPDSNAFADTSYTSNIICFEQVVPPPFMQPQTLCKLSQVNVNTTTTVSLTLEVEWDRGGGKPCRGQVKTPAVPIKCGSGTLEPAIIGLCCEQHHVIIHTPPIPIRSPADWYWHSPFYGASIAACGTLCGTGSFPHVATPVTSLDNDYATEWHCQGGSLGSVIFGSLISGPMDEPISYLEIEFPGKLSVGHCVYPYSTIYKPGMCGREAHRYVGETVMTTLQVCDYAETHVTLNDLGGPIPAGFGVPKPIYGCEGDFESKHPLSNNGAITNQTCQSNIAISLSGFTVYFAEPICGVLNSLAFEFDCEYYNSFIEQYKNFPHTHRWIGCAGVSGPQYKTSMLSARCGDYGFDQLCRNHLETIKSFKGFAEGNPLTWSIAPYWNSECKDQLVKCSDGKIFDMSIYPFGTSAPTAHALCNEQVDVACWNWTRFDVRSMAYGQASATFISSALGQTACPNCPDSCWGWTGIRNEFIPNCDNATANSCNGCYGAGPNNMINPFGPPIVISADPLVVEYRVNGVLKATLIGG